MNYYCTVCVKQLILNLLHIINMKNLFRKITLVKNPNFFDVDKIYNDCIINHKKVFDL